MLTTQRLIHLLIFNKLTFHRTIGDFENIFGEMLQIHHSVNSASVGALQMLDHV